MIPYVAPEYHQLRFNCPICNAYAHQVWTDITYRDFNGTSLQVRNLNLCQCTSCAKMTYWVDGKMIYPDKSNIPPPNSDLSPDIINDYNEARLIINKSPRGAVALLRLAVQKLCLQLGEKGKNLNEDIASLVKKGLRPEIQQALDYTRVIGNNAVHPGQIDLTDDAEKASILFKMINFIAQTMITDLKQIQELYNTLPEGMRTQINKRDANNTPPHP